MPGARTIAKLPTSDRPRERLAAAGPEALSDIELLALVLRNGRIGASALDLAIEMLAEYGSLHAIAAARFEELTRSPGVGEAKAAALIAAFRLGRRAEQVDGSGQRLRGPEDVARIAGQELQGLRRERVIVLVCDGANRLKKVVRVSEGSIDRAMVPVREILNAVLVNDGRAFAVAHNHPSGHPEASPRDVEATSDLVKAAATTGVRFLGHVIVTRDRWADAGQGASAAHARGTSRLASDRLRVRMWQNGGSAQPRRCLMDRAGQTSEQQGTQRDLVELARSLPGVAEVMDVYGRLEQYTNILVNVQPSQVRNATGGNG